jgi:hypothetical protein
VEGTWNGCVNFHRASTVLVYTCSKPKQLSDLEWISRQIGRWGGSSRVNEGMGVNRPSVTALRPDHRRRNSRHTQPLQTNWQERKCGGGERARRGIAKENWRNPGNTGSSEYQEKESNLRPGLFSCIRRRRVTFILDFR